MKRLHILLAFGGESAEHDVSIASARNVFAALSNQKYDTTLCYITKNGQWQKVQNIDQLNDQDPQLLPVLGGGHFTTTPGGERITPDVILPIIHGTNGEDGSMQGLAQLLHIPIAGCGVLASALCMDKEVTKRLLQHANLPVADYAVHYAHQPTPSYAKLTLKLGSPLFIKPATQGSSVGVSRVVTEAEFETALQKAHQYDTKILIEQAITGQEIECAVLGNEQPKASILGEIRPGEDFYSYNDKYSQTSKAQLIIPANIPAETAETVRSLAIQAYRTLECRGLARIDFFVTKNNIYINELNTLPGFTNISMYPKLWQASGIHYPQLIDEIIALAV